MGMDIYFQAFDAEDKPLGPRQELRCRDIYHTFNDWCKSQAGDTPESGEHVSFDAEQWQTLAPRICKDIADTQRASLGDSEAQAAALGLEWLRLIWPPGTVRAEYWFTV